MMSDTMERLYEAVLARRAVDPATSRTAKLLAMGLAKIAQKVGEEAIEVVIDAMTGTRDGVVRESADLLYHLTILWSHLGIEPTEIWTEMTRREAMMGIAEKLPKNPSAGPHTG
jgi:phosphoribosyl-ATP pyrophosphohydrolase